MHTRHTVIPHIMFDPTWHSPFSQIDFSLLFFFYSIVYARVSGAYDWIRNTVCSISDDKPFYCGGPTARPTSRPTPSPTPQPTRRPTRSPTPQPTPSPTPRPTNRPNSPPTDSPGKSCEDDPSWFTIVNGRTKNCKWVAKKTKKRCQVQGSDGTGRSASEGCPESCGASCPTGPNTSNGPKPTPAPTQRPSPAPTPGLTPAPTTSAPVSQGNSGNWNTFGYSVGREGTWDISRYISKDWFYKGNRRLEDQDL